jgi:hypothetical protein
MGGGHGHGVASAGAVAIGAAVLTLVAGCGGGSSTAAPAESPGGSKAAICFNAEEAFDTYSAQMNGVAGLSKPQWEQDTNALAGRLGTYAQRSTDATLKSTLNGMATAWRAIAPQVRTGDTATFNVRISTDPHTLATLCQ